MTVRYAPMSKDTTRLLLRIDQESDQTAFREFFARYAPRVKSLLLRATRGDNTLSDELTQETMLRVWRHAGSFSDDKGTAASWIFTIARNVRIDHARRKRPLIDSNDLAFVEDDSPRADATVASREQARNLRAAVATLPDDQRAVLEGLYFDDLTFRELAEASDLPVGTVKSRARLGLARLRRHLPGDSQ